MNTLQVLLVLGQIAPEQPSSSLPAVLVLLAPLLVFLVFACVTICWAMARQRRIQNRAMEHMDRLESKTDEMIQLLRDVRDRLSQRDD